MANNEYCLNQSNE